MRITVAAVGKIKPPFREADAHYRRLLARHQPLDVREVRDERDLLRKLPSDAHGVALDRQGVALSSLEWSRWLERRRLEAREVWILIGGPHGLSDANRGQLAERLSLGPETLPHQLARIVLLEQLFRAAKILAGEPYHY